jgi:hypothetical protein
MELKRIKRIRPNNQLNTGKRHSVANGLYVKIATGASGVDPDTAQPNEKEG